MEISYYYVNPTGNITLLADTPVEKPFRSLVARKLMELEPSAEQVGFVSGTRLEMAGGEFCGNACISAAAVYCSEKKADRFEGGLRVSGADRPVYVKAEKKNGIYEGSVRMPEAVDISEAEVTVSGEKRKLPMIVFPGISHLIIESETDKKEVESLMPALCRSLGCEALGAMFLDEKSKRITPLVYVPDPETSVWESSCASGTTAVGIYLGSRCGGAFKADFAEPGGILGIEVSPDAPPVLRAKAEIKYRKTVIITY